MFKLYNLIIYSGVLAIIFLIAAAVFGLAKLNLEVHEHLGILALVFGLIHGGLIGYKNIKIRQARNPKQ